MTKENKAFRKLVHLGSKGDTAPYSYSPNDVLVQIALPLILILAIATRLMMVGQALQAENNDDSKIIIDLWKQQFILRIDKILEDWETSSGITLFSEFSRVNWNDGWPDDNSFKKLCSDGLALSDVNSMKMDIYRQVLTYRPDTGADDGTIVKWPLYDPSIQKDVQKPEGLPHECIIDNAKRDWAMRHIEERCMRWKNHLEYLQWSSVDKVISSLPTGNDITHRSLAVQMKNLTRELAAKGYPLLPGISDEYNINSERQQKDNRIEQL